jgi:hypothetical protein
VTVSIYVSPSVCLSVTGLFELPEIVDNFDYYWRLDADSFLLKPILKDPFKTLRDSGREYGYMVVTQEDESVVLIPN